MHGHNESKRRSFLSTGLILTAVTGGTAVMLTVGALPFVAPALRKICLPYVPATKTQVQNVLLALCGKSGPIVDLGSGDGRIVLAAAKVGFRAHGVELNPWLMWYSRLQAFKSRLSYTATFSREDLWKFSLAGYKSVVIFGVEEMMEQLQVKVERELHPDGCVVACRFPFPNWTAEKTMGNGIDTVWVYSKSGISLAEK